MTTRLVLSVCTVLLAVGVLSAQSPSTVQSSSTRPVSSERFEDYTRSHQEKHDLEREALTRARETTELRLKEMNNLREQITQERGQYITRQVFDVRREQVDDRLNALEQKQSSAEGASAAYLIGIGVFFTLVQLALRFGLPYRPTLDTER